MIPGNPNGQVWIAKDIKKVEPVARTSLVYPIDVVEAMTVSASLVSVVTTSVIKNLPSVRDAGQIAVTFEDYLVRTLPRVDYAREAGMLSVIAEDYDLRTLPRVDYAREAGELSVVLEGWEFISVYAEVPKEAGMLAVTFIDYELTTA